MLPFLEHYNFTVSDLDKSIKFFTTVLPEFKLRKKGVLEDKYDDTVVRTPWAHVGTEESYVALQATPDNMPFHENKYSYFNHMGFVVGSVDQILERVMSLGYTQFRVDDTHPHRKRAYVWVFDNNVLEFVEYYTDKSEEKNDYDK